MLIQDRPSGTALATNPTSSQSASLPQQGGLLRSAPSVMSPKTPNNSTIYKAVAIIIYIYIYYSLLNDTCG